VFAGLAYAESNVVMTAITRSPGGPGLPCVSLGIGLGSGCDAVGAIVIPIGAKRFSRFTVPNAEHLGTSPPVGTFSGKLAYE
jgi:hypothetical protein